MLYNLYHGIRNRLTRFRRDAPKGVFACGALEELHFRAGKIDRSPLPSPLPCTVGGADLMCRPPLVLRFVVRRFRAPCGWLLLCLCLRHVRFCVVGAAFLGFCPVLRIVGAILRVHVLLLPVGIWSCKGEALGALSRSALVRFHVPRLKGFPVIQEVFGIGARGVAMVPCAAID